MCQSIIGLIVSSHLLLKLWGSPSDILNLMLELLIDLLSFPNLLLEVLLVLFHDLVHLLDFVKARLELHLKRLDLILDIDKLLLSIIELGY